EAPYGPSRAGPAGHRGVRRGGRRPRRPGRRGGGRHRSFGRGRPHRDADRLRGGLAHRCLRGPRGAAGGGEPRPGSAVQLRGQLGPGHPDHPGRARRRLRLREPVPDDRRHRRRAGERRPGGVHRERPGDRRPAGQPRRG
ncbi:MAG: Molybdenum ABC transporter, substrate-binding protein ModA, partial [uncultured Pseudonocardia sp.]